jgi:hypothetical protein
MMTLASSITDNKLETSLIDDARVIIYDHHMFIVPATESLDLDESVFGLLPK